MRFNNSSNIELLMKLKLILNQQNETLPKGPLDTKYAIAREIFDLGERGERLISKKKILLNQKLPNITMIEKYNYELKYISFQMRILKNKLF